MPAGVKRSARRRLLVAERGHRIELSGAPGGVDAEDEPDAH